MPTDPRATRRLRRLWDRLALVYDLLAWPMERMMGLARGRGWAFKRAAKGRMLELGAGTGRNVPYYLDGATVVATDLSPGMLARAARKACPGPTAAQFVVTDAEDLAFREGVFDAVVATCVFCCVPDPVRGLNEARRVLREGGEIVLLEHVRPQGLMGRLFDLLDPMVSRLMGPHINRQTLDSVRKTGLEVVEARDVFSNWFKLIVAR